MPKPQGDLFGMRGQLSEAEVRGVMWQLLCAVGYLHANKVGEEAEGRSGPSSLAHQPRFLCLIVALLPDHADQVWHRDIKSANIMMALVDGRRCLLLDGTATEGLWI